MDELQTYLRDKIKLFGGNFKDAKMGSMAVTTIHKEFYEEKYPSMRTRGILETLYEVYRITNQ